MAELKGTFYGVSIGPGDPELMTLQAVRLIRQCPVLAAPQTASGQMLALDIARSALGEALDGKTIVPLYFAMSRDPAALAALHEKAAAAVRQYLDAGQDVAMLTSVMFPSMPPLVTCRRSCRPGVMPPPWRQVCPAFVRRRRG